MEKVYSYLTISKKSESFIKDKGSKFYGYAFPLESEDDIKTSLEEIKNIHPKARHVCYAYRFGFNNEHEKASDAGEPSGSAGLPILNQIKSFNLTNTLVIVVRYFGGTKLGISGLISAYKLATKDALENNNAVENDIAIKFNLSSSYENANHIFSLVNSVNGNILKQDYSSVNVKFEVEIPLKSESEFVLKVEENQWINFAQ